ncbi:hypothetical protein DL768_005442 [Monosporascus sp. mg162]|nr:hypothetical protein DL768_005442 [Monosporascus sp. mg162]
MAACLSGLPRSGPRTARFGFRGIVASRAAWQRGRNLQRRGIVTSDLSYAEGPTEPPLLPHSIPEHFASIVSQYGDRPAVIARSPTPVSASLSSPEVPPTTTLTYESLDALSNALAHSLRSLGVRKGDRVAVSLGNVAEHTALIYAAFKLGAVLVPLNPSFNAQQLAAALEHLGVEVLVIAAVADVAYRPCRGRANLGLLEALIPDLRAPKVEAPAVPSLRSVVVLDNRASHPEAYFPLEELRALVNYEDLLLQGGGGRAAAVTPDAPLAPHETINIQFTSGTTSRPKAPMLTHAGILNNGHLIARRMGLGPADRVVCPPPLFHCFGSVLGLMATATTGAALLLPSPAFDPAASLRMAAEHAATALYGVPTMFITELDLLSSNPAFAQILAADGDGFRNLRKGIAAGSSVPEALVRRLADRLGLTHLVICYGMTETSPVSCMTSPADPAPKRAATVGRPMPHTAVRVVAPGDRTGRVLPRGERGELAVSGYLVMRGYYGDEETTRRDLVPDGADGGGRAWMYTGDEARMDGDGYVEITGRIKDLIIRGGENIHPLEVENCLLGHPLVRDASVVGVPDDRYGEVVGAFVVPARGVRTVDASASAAGGIGGDGGVGVGMGGISPLPAREERQRGGVLSKDDLKEWVRTNLSGHLVPKYVFWIDEYPKTASGKIQKFKLRELARELLAKETQ